MSCLAVLLFFLLPQNDLLSLSGAVVDTEAKGAGNVLVRLEQPTEQKRWETSTLTDGSFRFERLSYGTYRVTIHKAGYFDVSAEVRLETSKSVEFTLAAAEKVEQEIDVVARPEPINSEAVSSQNTVNDEVIQNIPYPGRQNILNDFVVYRIRSEEHTSELQSRPHLVCRLLLEKKKNNKTCQYLICKEFDA